MTSPTVPINGEIPKAYLTCSGKGTWPTLKITKTNPRSVELVVMAIEAAPGLPVHWAIAGLKPSTKEIVSGKLPPGAIVGNNSFGGDNYDMCPTSGTNNTYAFQAYELRHRLKLKPGWDAPGTRTQLLRSSYETGILAFKAAG